ncbi:hypothetical protein B0J17DRAFT_115541 [Rhizoctonia solani]|nr:hypothetical protein B0J17DRAFT_115541 [Rhizoctonia solani]
MDATASIDFNTVSRDPVPSILCTHCDIYPARLHDGTRVALKTVIIYEALAIKEASRRKERMSKLLDIWAKCDHPNIVQMIGRTRFLGQTNAVYEWHEYGSFSVNHPISFLMNYYQSAQICEGLAYLHANDIIHGELNGVSQVTN